MISKSIIINLEYNETAENKGEWYMGDEEISAHHDTAVFRLDAFVEMTESPETAKAKAKQIAIEFFERITGITLKAWEI